MTYTIKKRNLLRPEAEKWKSTFMIALLVAAAFFIPFIIYDNGYFLFYGDFNVQQVPFYQMCHDMVRSGRITWNWNTDLGVNFIGSYSFYLLGSPFFWLTIPFPNWMVPYLMGPLLILKFACSALTAYFYIRRFTKSPDTARLGGLLYAFSGFSVYNIFFNHFHEAIIVFPLLLLSIELMLAENRRGVFALMVGISAIVNYFFFFGMVIFCVIYWLVRLLSENWRITVGRVLAFFFEAVIGLGISAVLLLPSAAALLENTRLSELLLGWNAIMYGKEQIYANIFEVFFFPPDLPARPVFFPDANVKWSSLGGWMPLFSMVGVFAWFRSKKRNWLKLMITILAVMAFVPILNSAFYMFNYAYYARWFYMPILMMALATSMSIEDREVEWKGAFRWVLAITAIITLVIGLFPKEDGEGGISFGLFTDPHDPTYIFRFWITCAIALVCLFILYYLLKFIRTNHKLFLRSATAAVCIFSIIYAALFISQGKTHGFNSKEIMIPQLVEGEVDLGQSDKNVFRIDTYSGVDNTGMYLGLYSINAFHSIVPVGVTEFYEYIGEERGVGSRPTTDSYAIRSLLSCRYLLNRVDGEDFEEDGETKMPGWNYYTFESGYNVYENENYIPFGFTYDYYMTEAECESYMDSDRANMMLKAILLSPDQIDKYSDLLRNIEDDYSETYHPDKPTIDLSEDGFAQDCKDRAKSAAQYFAVTDNGFESDIVLNKDNLVFFSVPYDEGWSATVNGKPVEIEKVNIGFMAVKASAGENKIDFTYQTPGLKIGLIITCGSLLILLIYFIVHFIFFKSSDLEYPEGEALLEKWQAYDLDDAAKLSAQLELDQTYISDFLNTEDLNAEPEKEKTEDSEAKTEDVASESEKSDPDELYDFGDLINKEKESPIENDTGFFSVDTDIDFS